MASHLFATRTYAEALAGAGAVVPVPEWGSHVTRRRIAGFFDAGGIYPFQVLSSGADIGAGLARLADQGLVSVVLAPDPLLCSTAPQAFSFHRPFKTQYLVDSARGGFRPSKHHRERIRRGLRRCRIEKVALTDRLDEWRALYAGLVARHGVTGPAAFDDAYFEMLAAEPVITTFIALVGDVCAGMTLWFAADGVVYNHLTAANGLGYANGASFALYDAAIAHFTGQGVVNLGGGAGISDAGGGLAAFKQGFSNSEVQASICGEVLDPMAYDRLCAGRPPTSFFPPYRTPMQAAA